MRLLTCALRRGSYDLGEEVLQISNLDLPCSPVRKQNSNDSVPTTALAEAAAGSGQRDWWQCWWLVAWWLVVGGWWRGGWWVVSVVVVVARCCDQLSLRSWADPCRVGLGLRPPPIMDRANILHRARLDQVFKRQCGQRTRPQWRLGVAGDAAVVAQHVRDARYIRAGCKANSADIRHLSGAG